MSTLQHHSRVHHNTWSDLHISAGGIQSTIFTGEVEGVDDSGGPRKSSQVEGNNLEKPWPIFSPGVGDRIPLYAPDSTSAKGKRLQTTPWWCVTAVEFCKSEVFFTEHISTNSFISSLITCIWNIKYNKLNHWYITLNCFFLLNCAVWATYTQITDTVLKCCEIMYMLYVCCPEHTLKEALPSLSFSVALFLCHSLSYSSHHPYSLIIRSFFFALSDLRVFDEHLQKSLHLF